MKYNCDAAFLQAGFFWQKIGVEELSECYLDRIP